MTHAGFLSICQISTHMPDIYPYAGYLPAGGWQREARVVTMTEMSESRDPPTYVKAPDPSTRLASEYRIQMKTGSLDPSAMHTALAGICG
jgi:hypothetical protein